MASSSSSTPVPVPTAVDSKLLSLQVLGTALKDLTSTSRGHESDDSDVESSLDYESNLSTANCLATEVLDSADLYVCLGLQRKASDEEISQCYLQRAVQLHPASSDGEAQTSLAFQRLAAAWLELSDAAGRWRYDAELDAGRGLISTSSSSSSFSAPSHVLLPMDEKRALEVFASATTQVSSNRKYTVSSQSLEEVLAQAEKLLRPPLLSLEQLDAPDISVKDGLVMSAGLFAASFAATAVGFPALGACARTCAVYQGVTNVALGGFRVIGEDVVKDSCDKLRTSAASCVSRIEEEAVGRLVETLSSCLPRSVPSESEDSLEECDNRIFLVGDAVKLEDLEVDACYNGRRGKILAIKGGCFEVLLDPPLVSTSHSDTKKRLLVVKKANLVMDIASPRSVEDFTNAPRTLQQFI